MSLFNVYQMDMQSDGEGWVENSRMHIGIIEVSDAELESNERCLIEALRDMDGEDITGHSRPVMAPTADLDTLFIEDVYGSGEWYEIGVDDDERMPIWGLELKD